MTLAEATDLIHALTYSAIRTALANRKVIATLAITTLLIGVNWLTFIYAVVAGHVLEGSVRTSGETLRITAQLVNVREISGATSCCSWGSRSGPPGFRGCSLALPTRCLLDPPSGRACGAPREREGHHHRAASRPGGRRA